MDGVVPLLVLAPLLAGLAALAVPTVLVRTTCLAGAGFAFLLSLWACGAASTPGTADLRAVLAGPLDRALARAGVEDELARVELRALVHDGIAPGTSAALAELEGLALLPQARSAVHLARRQGEPARLRAAEAELAEAQAALDGLARAHAAAAKEVAGLARAARGPWGTRFRLVSHAEWVPPLGMAWLLGVDGLSAPLAAVVTLLALVVLLAAPEAGSARTRGAAGRATRGQLAAVPLVLAAQLLGLVALDLAALQAAQAAALVPFAAVVAGTGRRGHELALRLVAAGLAAAGVGLVASAAVALAAPGAPSWSLPVLHGAARAGALDPALQAGLWGTLLAVALLRLPLPPLGGWQVEAVGLLPPWLGAWWWGTLPLAALWPLARVAWPLAPEVATDPRAVQLVVLAGAAAVLGGGLALVRAGSIGALLRGATIGQAGLVLIGLGAPSTLAAAGAVLVLVGAGPALAGAALALSRVAERLPLAQDPSALSGLARLLPRLGGLTGAFLVALGGAPGTIGFAAGAMVLAGARDATLVSRPVSGLAVLAAVVALVAAGQAAGRLLLGPRPEATNQAEVVDLATLDAQALVPLAALVIGLGLMPGSALALVTPGAAWITGVDLPLVR